MNETYLQWIAFSKVIGISVFSLMYGLGGMNHKPLRRIWGTLVLTLQIMIFSLMECKFSWWYLLCYPLLIGATSLGYGASETWKKIIKRSYCGLAYSVATYPVFIVQQQWAMMILHTCVCLVFSVFFGVINPVDARHEETAIGVAISCLPLFTI